MTGNSHCFVILKKNLVFYSLLIVVFFFMRPVFIPVDFDVSDVKCVQTTLQQIPEYQSSPPNIINATLKSSKTSNLS